MKNLLHCLFSSTIRQPLDGTTLNPWIAASVGILLALPITQAATFTWDASAANPTAPTDGEGMWNTNGAANWSDGTADVNWTNASDTAVFGSNNGPAGPVTLGTGITVGGITFNSSTSGIYTIVGAGNLLTFGGATNFALATASTNAAISAELAIADSVTIIRKAGPGILELAGGGTATRIESGPGTGSLFVTGGTFTLGALNFYDTGRGDDGTTNGNVFQTGGTVTVSENWDGRNKTSSYNITGGTLAATPPNRIRGLGNFNASGDAVVTFTTNDPRIASESTSGTLSVNGNASFTHLSDYAPFDLANSGNPVSGTINLGGGTLTVLGIHNGSAVASGFVNFNGGTLKVSTSIQGASFFNAKALNTVSVYGGGAVVDTNTKNINISQPLLATVGNGIDTVTVTAGGSGYTKAPVVFFVGGGGAGATGYALINTSGAITSIVITNPGMGYSSAPAVSFDSGSATATATAALVNANGGFTKTGTGTLTLLGANTYTGPTIINDGTLSYNAPGLLDSSTVRINGDGTLNLNFFGNDSVAALFIDNVQMPDGLYDVNDASGCFSGSGVLSVGISSADPYTTWEAANGITGAGAAADSDNDGITNGIEFVIGGDPSGPDSDSNSLLEPVAVDADNLTFVFRRTSASASSNPFVEYSTNLGIWTKAEAGVNNVTVAVDPESYGAGIDKVTVAIPRALAADARLFARLKVVLP